MSRGLRIALRGSVGGVSTMQVDLGCTPGWVGPSRITNLDLSLRPYQTTHETCVVCGVRFYLSHPSGLCGLCRITKGKDLR